MTADLDPELTISFKKDFSSAITRVNEDFVVGIDKYRGSRMILDGNPYVKITIEILHGKGVENE